MKKIFTISLCAFGLVLLANTASFAQATATASSSATIVTPISIVKNLDLAFGNFATNGTAGSLSLAASAAGTRTPGTGVTLPATSGTVNAAKFTVSGQTGYGFSENFSPATVTLTDGGSGTTHNMTLTPVLDATSGTLTGGSAIIYLGGSLAVNTGQLAGAYTSTSNVTVTVNYN